MARPPSSRKALVNAMEGAPCPVYVVNADRRFAYCNPACLAWLAVEESNIVGKVCRYHSDPHAESAVADGLSPPPEVWAGKVHQSTVWTVGQKHQMRRRTADFVPMPSDDGRYAVFAVVAQSDLTQDHPLPLSPARLTPDQLHQCILQARSLVWPLPLDSGLVGQSAAIRRTRAQVDVAVRMNRESHASAANSRVLITGPVGSGRERIARLIHRESAQGEPGLLLPLECGLLDAELLNATFDRFLARQEELTAIGPPTLLLLDLDQLELDAQTTLLEFLDSNDLSFQILATATADCPTRGRGHHDLFDFVSTIVVVMPSLDERRADIPLLVQALIEEQNLLADRSSADHQIQGASEEVLELLANHTWRRDVQELTDVVAAAHERCRTQLLEVEDLPETIALTADAERYPHQDAPTINLDQYLAEIERELVERALIAARGNRAAAARLLGVSRARLLRKVAMLESKPEVESSDGSRDPSAT